MQYVPCLAVHLCRFHVKTKHVSVCVIYLWDAICWKTKVFLQSKIMTKSHPLLKYVQSPATGSMGAPLAPAPTGLPRSRPPGPGEKGTVCCWLGTAAGLPAPLQGRKGPLQEMLCLPPSPGLCSLYMKLLLHTTAPLSFKASVTMLLELGQKTTLVSSVSYKMKTKAKKVAHRGNLFPRKVSTKPSVRNR